MVGILILEFQLKIGVSTYWLRIEVRTKLYIIFNIPTLSNISVRESG
jgi:hypothetical protein